MIESIGQVMLYVDDVEQAKVFWIDKVRFAKAEKQDGENLSYVLFPSETSDVQLVLHDKAVVAQMNPEMNLGTPSLLLSTRDIDATYQQFIAKGIQANPVVDLGAMKVFNFSDEEGNYFAVREVR